MKALIIEDEPRARRSLLHLLDQRFPQVTVIGACGSVKETLAWLHRHNGTDAPAPDVILMDVELSDGNCFDLFAQADLNAAVIMTTAYDSYAVKAFEVGSVDYLLKPIDPDELQRALGRAATVAAADMQRVREAFYALQPQGGSEEEVSEHPARPVSYKEKFLIRLNDRIVPVHTRDIAYFYSESKNSYIVTDKSVTYVLDDSLDALAEQLAPEAFYRISRSCIVAETAIESVSKLLGGRLRVSLREGIDAFTDLTVSRARVDGFLSWLEK